MIPAECNFVPDSDDPRIKRCSRQGCTNRLITDDPPERCHAVCESPVVAPPLLKRALNFVHAAFGQAPLVGAAIIHWDSSEAFREQDEIERIAEICKSCRLFDGERCTHAECGCPVNADRAKFLSKLAWRSQHCPDGRWS